MGYSGINGAFEEVGLSSLNNTHSVNFNEYGSLGQFIAGNYNGQLVRERHDSTGMVSIIDTVYAAFNFRVRHTTNLFKKNDIAKLCKDRFKPAFT